MRVYKTTACFPKQELYGLTSQVRRSAASIPTNIAEGCGRGSDGEFGQFLQIAMGSASELEYQIVLVRDLGFLDDNVEKELEGEVVQVKKMLAALIHKLRADR